LTVAHTDMVAAVDLVRRNQIRQRLNDETLDSALQMTSPIPEICALRQQELAGAIGDADLKRHSPGSGPDALLHHLKLNVNDPAQFLAAQRLKDYDLVQTVDKLWRELSTGRRYARACHLSLNLRVATGALRPRSLEPQPRSEQRAHFGGS
jgi:hypothetical protein